MLSSFTERSNSNTTDTTDTTEYRMHCCICQDMIDFRKYLNAIIFTSCNFTSHKECANLWEDNCPSDLCPGCKKYDFKCKPQEIRIKPNGESSAITNNTLDNLIATLHELNEQLLTPSTVSEHKLKKFKAICEMHKTLKDFFECDDDI